MPKLLGQFLEEQQEPFILDDYLLERGYCARTIKRRGRPIPSCADFVTAVLKRLVLHDERRIKKAVLKRLVFLDNRKIKESVDREIYGDEDEDGDGDEDEDDFTTASATTLYSSCSESSDAECVTKQSDSSVHELSPISVLEETESQATPLHQKQYNFKKTKGGSSSSSSKKPKHKSFPNFKEQQCMDAHDQYIINKRALQHSKKLLVDCVREVIENERRRDDGRGQQLKRILGAEELWKAVCENVWVWSQESVHEKKMLHLLHCDFMASLQEWTSSSHQERHGVLMEIGDAILEDVIVEVFTS